MHHSDIAQPAPLTTAGGLSSRYRRIVPASCFGSAIEWYDFFVYSFLVPLVFDRLRIGLLREPGAQGGPTTASASIST